MTHGDERVEVGTSEPDRNEIVQTLHLLSTVLYFVVLITLSAYGAHRYVMIYLYYRHRRAKIQPPVRFTQLPSVTVQLPLYNEMYVTERLLAAVAALEYPKDKIEIQVLDDSTDETTEIVANQVRKLQQSGFAVEHIHRQNRAGFKAGALENGLHRARGEFIAIFDADFVPQPDLLQRTIHHFTDPGIGMVQTRWGHLNESYSFLTRLQSMFLDGHFVIEQTARSRSGRFFNFNGTAGIWRRSCIEQSGGWHHDTLAEDLDLSYRAQIRGWRFVFLPEIVTPAELPVEINAFKSQQHRWAKGAIQACKKMLPALWRAPLPLKIKLEGTIHLTCGFGHVLLLVLCLLLHPAAAAGTAQTTGGNQLTRFLLVDLPIFFAASVSISAFYFCAQTELHTQWWKRLLYVPVLMAVGVGLSVNNARAVLEAVFNHQTEFVRTPKFGVCSRQDSWMGSKYRAWRGLVSYVEIGFGLYFSYLLATALGAGQWSMLPFLMLFQLGFLYVGLTSLMHSRGRGTVPVVPALTPAGA
jgi:cellulose synthase/poly-beta-1,6-N-acetylglucosamine synthase-like glycosyltransferase